LVTTQAVRCGEAILVEEPLFMSPGGMLDWKAVADLCDSEKLAVAIKKNGKDGRLSISEQLVLTISQAFIEKPQPPQCKALMNLDGDKARWKESASALYALLREELQSELSEDLVSEVYAIVASNSHGTYERRASIFAMGSMCEHSCAPSAFKEVVQRDRPTLVVRALRDLIEGEVVSLSYIPEYQATWKRKELLQSMYGFDCVCERCTNAPERVCTFVCPECEGPCSPATPVKVGVIEFPKLTFLCDHCKSSFAGDSQSAIPFVAAQESDTIGDDSAHSLYPYHYKIVNMYLESLGDIPAEHRVPILEQLCDAYRRLFQVETHPILSRLTEKLANAQMELGDMEDAAASFETAAEIYAAIYRGAPSSDHQRRCEERHQACISYLD